MLAVFAFRTYHEVNVLMVFTMYRQDNIEQESGAFLSDNTVSACRSILEQLQLIIPCTHWLLAFKPQDRDASQWIIFTQNSHNSVTMTDSLQHCLDDLRSDSAGKRLTVESDQCIGVELDVDHLLFSGLVCGYQPLMSDSLTAQNYERVYSLSTLIAYQLKSEIKIREQHYKIKQLLNLSHTDSLTQLLNKRAWSQMLVAEEARAKRYFHTATVFIIDLDSLKTINDSKGHHAGDALIIEAANCLQDICRESDVVARLGGDEFGLLAIKCDRGGAQALLDTINHAFSRSSINASVGYSVMGDEMDLLGAVQLADKNMYAVKNSKTKHATDVMDLPQIDVCQ